MNRDHFGVLYAPLPSCPHLICEDKQRVHTLNEFVAKVAVLEAEVHDITEHILKIVRFALFHRRLRHFQRSNSAKQACDLDSQFFDQS